jgi:general secretion pathway protein M
MTGHREILKRLTEAWGRLGRRERLYVTAGLGAALVLGAYGLLWLPMQREIEQLKASVPKVHEQLQWMRAQAPQAKGLGARPTTAGSEGLLSAVEQSAVNHGLKGQITRIEQEGSHSVRLALDAVPFNTLILWLAELQKAQALVVDDMTLEVHTVSGSVNARLRLRAGAA